MSHMNVRELKLESNAEDLFLTGMIVSDEFLKGIAHVFEPIYFKSGHIRKVSEWVIDYYEEFKEAPQSEIQNIFEVEARNEDIADAELIETLLYNISKRYVGQEFNAGYLVPKMLDYIRERVVEITLDDARWNLRKKGADEAWLTLNKIKEVRQQTHRSINFIGDFKKNFDTWYYANKEELMRFPGALGYYFAPLLRKKLIAFLAPPKRGKSWWLLYTAYMAATHRLKVAFFSLEMSEEEVQERLAVMISAHEPGNYENTYTFPQCDCALNQSGNCTNPRWVNPSDGIIENGAPMEYEEVPDWQICTECRVDWSERDAPYQSTDYEFAPWMHEEKRKQLNKPEIQKEMERFALHFGSNALKLFTYRIGTASVADIENDLDEEERLFGWVPDVVVIDYADITKKDAQFGERRHQLSDIWEQLSGMTKERNVLTFTASQGNRGSASKRTLGADDISEDWGKVMIVDGLITINEDNKEKNKTEKDRYWQVQRLKWVAHRYKKDLREWEECTVLQNLGLGQVALDSEIT